MKRKIITAIAGLTAIAITIPLAGADSFRNMSTAVGDSADASARIVASGGQVLVGAVAVPLAAVGGLSEATGQAAGSIASDMWDTANAPLIIDEAVVIAQPAPVVPEPPKTTTRTTTTTTTTTTKSEQ